MVGDTQSQPRNGHKTGASVHSDSVRANWRPLACPENDNGAAGTAPAPWRYSMDIGRRARRAALESAQAEKSASLPLNLSARKPLCKLSGLAKKGWYCMPFSNFHIFGPQARIYVDEFLTNR